LEEVNALSVHKTVSVSLNHFMLFVEAFNRANYYLDELEALMTLFRVTVKDKFGNLSAYETSKLSEEILAPASKDFPAIVKVERIDPFSRENMGSLSIEKASGEFEPPV